jgi:membrane-associated protease RseP (regulator of RpoE activity)
LNQPNETAMRVAAKFGAASDTDMARLLAASVSPVFAVERITTAAGDTPVIRLHGKLLADSEAAFESIRTAFRPYGYTPLLRQDADGELITAVPGLLRAKPTRDAGAIVMFVLTALSVLFAGAAGQAPDLKWLLQHPLAGLPFAAGLLAILIAHEFGHYFVARRLGVPTSLPYFIPMPLSALGTMGAVIRTRAPMRNRRQILAVGAAGPLAGLAVAIPVLIIGLLMSQVQPIPLQEGVWIEGNSVLYAAIKYLVFGQVLPRDGYDVLLHPLAFAAWAGLLVTALNLIPAGQLDGGHIAYALLGKRTRWLNRLAVVAVAALGFVWSGWFLWVLVLILFGQRNAEPLDDVTSLPPAEKLLAIAMLAVFVLLFTPVPMSIL